MPRAKVLAKPDYACELVRSFAINEQINQLLLDRLDPAAWCLKPPGSRTRSIAAVFAHMHNVRRKWIRLSAPQIPLPASLQRTCMQEEARAAFAASDVRCTEMIEEALRNADEAPRRVMKFVRDSWARPWPAGAAMVAYMIAHEAHHRGQICMLAHQVGFPLSGSTTSAMWSWERMSKGSF
jgi:uncharacterized damage-inducible protein DinB